VDIDRGLAVAGQAAARAPSRRRRSPGRRAGAQGPGHAEGTALLVLRNYHRFLASPEVVQALDTAISTGRQDRTFVVILAPAVQLPPELERQFVVVDHDLPGRDQLASIAGPWPPRLASCRTATAWRRCSTRLPG